MQYRERAHLEWLHANAQAPECRDALVLQVAQRANRRRQRGDRVWQEAEELQTVVREGVRQIKRSERRETK